MRYDIAIIGGGPAGYTAAERAAAGGLKTVLFEKKAIGGVCLNEGCIPTKTLLYSAKLWDTMKGAAKYGIAVPDAAAFDMGKIIDRKDKVVKKLTGGVKMTVGSYGVAIVEKEAVIAGEENGMFRIVSGGETYEATYLLVCTGSDTVVPPIPGLSDTDYWTSKEALESKELPQSLVIIGGGVIGVEFATFYSHLGCQVTLVEGMANLLPQLDRELGQNLAQILKKQGVEVLTSAMVQSVEQAADGLCVHLEQKGKELTVTGEKVLCAIGRRAYFDGLFAAGLTPALNGKRLLVDESYQTSIPGVYAIGDASAAVQLAHVAAAQGTDCVERMCGGKGSIDLNVIPSCIYSVPEIAAVGLAEAEAREQGIPAVSGKCTLFSNARAIIEDPGRCFMKLVARTDTHELIGAQLMCQHASDMISQLSTAMVNRLTVEQLLTVMRPHPSFEEALGEAVENLASKLA